MCMNELETLWTEFLLKILSLAHKEKEHWKKICLDLGRTKKRRCLIKPCCDKMRPFHFLL